MFYLSVVGLLALIYLLGSIPFGMIVVKVKTGENILSIQSGRTGGTNAMRAAGFGAGLFTVAMDILKGASAVWITKLLFPTHYWLHTIAPIVGILGHNYSIFLLSRDENGHLRFRGGAGGAPCLGGATGLWWPSFFVIVPLGAIIFFGVGYASVTTMSVAVLSILIFGARAILGQSPWQYILYGIVAELLLLWALRPNIRRLMNGTERPVGLRAKKMKAQSSPPDQS